MRAAEKENFDQMHSDLFSRPDSIFAVCFSIRNFDMPGAQIVGSLIYLTVTRSDTMKKDFSLYIKNCKL